MNLNKNQVRKDIPTTMMAFKIFFQWWEKQNFDTPAPKLLLHMHHNSDAGENLALLRDQHFQEVSEHILFPVIPENGFTVAKLNKYYNAADCLISSSYGEGWGLSTTESMICKTPVIVPQNTSNFEILGKVTSELGDAERGKFAASGADPDHWTMMDRCSHYGDPMRPVTSVLSMATQMRRIFEDCTDEKGNRLSEAKDGTVTKKQVEAAYAWAQELTWDKVFNDVWDKVFAFGLDRKPVTISPKKHDPLPDKVTI